MFARAAALLAVNGLPLNVEKISSTWLSAHVSQSEARDWLFAASRLAHGQQFTIPDDATRTPEFCSALVAAVFGDKRADTLLDNADVEYPLSFRDAEQIPAANRADVAMLLRDGHLTLFAMHLRPKNECRARVSQWLARLLKREAVALQKGIPYRNGGALVLRSNKGKDHRGDRQHVSVSRLGAIFTM